jgi:hypothetical protein
VLLLGDDGTNIATLSAEPEDAIAALLSSKVALAPKALAMTLFVRAFVCDLFIHGVGGGNYDRVTDEVFARYFGAQAPAFVVASATMHLPLGMPVVTDAEVAAARSAEPGDANPTRCSARLSSIPTANGASEESSAEKASWFDDCRGGDKKAGCADSGAQRRAGRAAGSSASRLSVNWRWLSHSDRVWRS